jgi:HlyD family secretion protein
MNLRAALIFSCSLALLTACSDGAYDGQILGTLERDRLELIAEANEPIVEILVREGDAVPAGATLLRQELGSMRARRHPAGAAPNVAERRLAELVKGPRAQEITEARAVLESARSMLDTETKEYDRVQDLVAHRLVSQSALDQQRARRDSAAGTEKQSTARLHLLLEGTRSEEVQQADATLKQAEAALAELQTSAARYVIKAPRAGRVEAIPYKLGERPAPGTPLIVMLADGKPYARVYVPEPLRTQFLPGARTRVRVDGRTNDLTGIVRFVSADAAFTPYYALTKDDRSRLSYLTLIDLDESAAANVPTGMPVQVELVNDKADDRQ